MARGDGTGPAVNYQGRGFDENEANAIETFPADLAVHKGDSLGFDVPAAFFHSFHKPYNITIDFTDMNLYIAKGKAT